MKKTIDFKRFALQNLVLIGIVTLCIVTAVKEPLFLSKDNFSGGSIAHWFTAWCFPRPPQRPDIGKIRGEEYRLRSSL